MKEIIDYTIVKTVAYGDRYVSIELQHPSQLPEVLPGQFVEVEVPDEKDVFLRRPISIHNVDSKNNTITLLVQIVGKGSHKIATLREGATLNIVGPLGHGFSTDAQRPLLVGGGAGTAPLRYLAKAFNDKGIAPTILLGGRSVEMLPMRHAFGSLGHLAIATEDGSEGFKGMVTQHPDYQQDYDAIYACGPTPMMKAVARDAIARGIYCEVSLENMMACGIGACLCCVCDTDQGHKCVCKDGPVFDARLLTHWING